MLNAILLLADRSQNCIQSCHRFVLRVGETNHADQDRTRQTIPPETAQSQNPVCGDNSDSEKAVILKSVLCKLQNRRELDIRKRGKPATLNSGGKRSLTRHSVNRTGFSNHERLKKARFSVLSRSECWRGLLIYHWRDRILLQLHQTSTPISDPYDRRAEQPLVSLVVLT